MNDSTLARRLADMIGQAVRSEKFCVAGNLPVVDPGLDVAGLGAIRFPLKPAAAKELIAHCRIAPYGKGTETLVDTKVRKAFELDASEFHMDPEWNAAVAHAAQCAAEQLGLPGDQVEVRLYKLLVYEKGGFFLPHRDSEKHDRMLASLIVVLPNPFDGGRLIVRHGGVERELAFEVAGSGKAACFAAFYADCEHEVKRVSRGVRIALAYNLLLKPGTTLAAAKRTAPADQLTGAIGSWIASHPAKPLVFALEHHYTQHGLTLDLLKGADRQLAEQVAPAAAKANCRVHLAQVTRHLLQFADDGSFEDSCYSRYSSRARGRHAIEIGETYEDQLKGAEWVDLSGRKQPWGSIEFDRSAIVSSEPIDEWEPTSEEFEGYTGNAGNTLDRWYHRSAIVVWHREHHFDVIATCGEAVSMPLFRAMAAALPETPDERPAEARAECIRFARAIIANWPHRHLSRWRPDSAEASPLEDFPDLLLTLRDRDAIALFLSHLAERDQTQRLAAFVVAACREFGWNTFDGELRQLLAARPEQPGRLIAGQRQEIPLRDLEWLSAFCLDTTIDTARSTLANELCAIAVKQFCAPFPPRPAYYGPSDGRESSPSATSLPFLLKALVATRRDEDLARVIQFVVSSPDEFRLADCQVPSLKGLLPWSQRQFGKVHPHLMSWFASVRQTLELATTRRPAPPADWARPAEVVCTCRCCPQLNAFLADPANAVARIPGREDVRQHLIGMIGRHACDVKYSLERKGSPYSLVLTKTNGSFERATERFEANRRLLKILDEVRKRIALKRRGRTSRLSNAGTQVRVASRPQ